MLSYKGNRMINKLSAQACGKLIIEILERKKPKIWNGLFRNLEDEASYIYWLARWAFHWARLSKEEYFYERTIS